MTSTYGNRGSGTTHDCRDHISTAPACDPVIEARMALDDLVARERRMMATRASHEGQMEISRGFQGPMTRWGAKLLIEMEAAGILDLPQAGLEQAWRTYRAHGGKGPGR